MRPTKRPARLVTRDDERGYVLLIVLVAMGVFAIVLISLLGMVTTDSRASSTYSNASSWKRSVDGAMQVGLAQLKATTTATLSNPSASACGGVSTGIDVPIENRTVTVDCIVAPPQPGDAPTRYLPTQGSGGDVLRLLQYYDIGAEDAAGQTLTTLIGAFGGDPTTFAGLIHLGDKPLTIYGDTKVRQWGLGSTPKGTGSSVDIKGSYADGDASSQAACGGQDAIANFLNPQREFKFSTTGTRQCGKGRDNVTLLAGAWDTPAAINSTPAVLPACVAGSVVTFTPGSYTPAQIATMNGWFSVGNCDDVTFLFQPGSYYFNAALTSATTGVLVFNDRTSNWVFGEPKGWAAPARATSASFDGGACDAAKQGVQIVLGPTTSLQMGSPLTAGVPTGRIAMCGRFTPRPDLPEGRVDLPMLSQQPAASLGALSWAGEPDLVVGGYGSPGTPEAVGASTAAAKPATYPTSGKPWDGSEVTQANSSFFCSAGCARGWVLSGFGTPSADSTRGLTSAVLKIRGTATNVRSQVDWWEPDTVGATRIIADVVLADNRTCSAIVNASPSLTPTTLNLLSTNTASPCAPIITTIGQLESAKITLTYVLNPIAYTTSTVNLDYVWMEATSAAGASPNPKPFNIKIDPTTGSSFNAFGKIALPRTQIDVKWQGDAATPPATELPLFVGDVTAKALASSTLEGPVSRHIGILAARAVAPDNRHVILRVTAGGMVLATTEVRVSDVTGVAFDPARQFQILNWSYCKVPVTTTATC